jgi:hypothetical protein
MFSISSPAAPRNLNEVAAATAARGKTYESDSSLPTAENQQSVTDHFTRIITYTFPKFFRERAISLLLYIMNFGKNVFQVNTPAILRIHGRKMNSSLTDYIYSSIVSKGTKDPPDDFEYFKTALNQINVPKHLMKPRKRPRSANDLKSGPTEPPKNKRSKWLSY